MPKIRKHIDIEAPPARVFAEVADPARQVEWALPWREVELLEGDGISQGSVQRWLFKVGPRSYLLETVVSESRQNETYARQVREGGLELRERFFILPQSGDVTRLEWVVEYEPPMGMLGRVLDALLLHRVFQNDMETSLERLKRRLEA
jgi:uncharacterized membrane protein